jgi:hypothetical protein
MAIDMESPSACDGPLVVLPWEANAHATFNAQPAATAIADATQAFKRECDLRSQKRTTGSARAVSKRAVAMDFPDEPQCLGEA